MQLLIKNGLILQTNETFVKGHIGVDQGKIAAVWYGEVPQVFSNTQHIDADSFLVCPGFIETHVHGGMGFDFSYEKAGWEKMEERLAKNGVTSILATLSSLPPEKTLKFIDRIVKMTEKNSSGRVNIEGIHMEGPYLNKEKKGIHLEENIRPGERDEAKRILERAKGLVKVWTLAPDIKENMALIETLAASEVSVSIAHTEADYDTAMAAFSAGANRVTHTFNTMPPLNHRYHGIINAAWQHGAFMELIADGYHVSPAIAKMFVSATDTNKIVLVSDNNEFSGFPDGKYIQDNRPIIIEKKQMKTEEGYLAGSLLTLNQCALNLTHWGFSLGAALKMISENPARNAGIFDRKGSINCTKDADIVIMDGQFSVIMTINGGRIVYKRQ
ncbi:MAG: N-acetylglucosamine-6-phosphate deacetylase [Treponema sp.]|jgi:N-acetylglucosamine-6-phosphate deacetylase|nr:N-acetylglucosamine-6-phosphate deacetylase [Treponema sp.]